MKSGARPEPSRPISATYVSLLLSGACLSERLLVLSLTKTVSLPFGDYFSACGRQTPANRTVGVGSRSAKASWNQRLVTGMTKSTCRYAPCSIELEWRRSGCPCAVAHCDSTA